jgi:PAS domain S-box-containing protein
MGHGRGQGKAVKPRHSIKNRVRAVIMLTSVTILTATSVAFLYYQVISFKAQLVRNLSTLATIIADNCAAALIFDNEESAAQILRALRAEPNIEAAVVYNSKGAVFTQYPRGIQPKVLSPPLAGNASRFTEEGLFLTRAIVHEDREIGTLYLHSSLSGLYQELLRYGTIITAVLIMSLVGAYVLATILQRRISDPIVALTVAATSVSEREDYTIRVPKMTDDELGVFTDAFNKMLAQTQNYESRLLEQARLLDLSFDAIIMRDQAGRIVYWNHGAEEVYGWTRAEAVGQITKDLLRTEYPEPLETIEETVRRVGRWSGELIQRRRDGVRIHVSTRWALDRDSQGRPAGVLISDNDVTGRKQAEENLKASREELRRALEFDEAVMTNMGEGLCTVDLQGQVTYLNPAAERLLGRSFAELRGRDLHAVIHRHADARRTFPPAECCLGQPMTDLEDVLVRKDGSEFDALFSCSPIRSGEKIAGVAVVFRDVSERNKAQEELLEREQQFRALGDNISQLAWMANAAGEIFWHNKRWREYTGQPETAANWDAVHHPDHRATVLAKWKVHLERGTAWEDTFPLRSKEGEYRWFLSRAVPIRDSQGRITRWVGTNTDITRQKMSEAELDRLVKERTAALQETITELEAFSYSVSHDMRAPLRAMHGYAEALREDYQDRLDAEAREYLDRIIRASQRLDSLVQDVLAYSRIAKGEIVLKPVDLSRLVEDILAAHPEFRPPSLQIHLETPLLPVLGHDAYLTQCVTNLLGNAAKFVAPGVVPEVRVRTERMGARVRVWFADNGIGIDPAHQERIFKIFGQVYPEKKYGGTGIGLAIVRRAVQRMGGEAGVESELGKGSRFWIVLNGIEAGASGPDSTATSSPKDPNPESKPGGFD